MVWLLLPPVRKRSGPYSYSPGAHTGQRVKRTHTQLSCEEVLYILGGEENVGRFDITVHNATMVAVSQRTEQLEHNHRRVERVQRNIAGFHDCPDVVRCILKRQEVLACNTDTTMTVTSSSAIAERPCNRGVLCPCPKSPLSSCYASGRHCTKYQPTLRSQRFTKGTGHFWRILHKEGAWPTNHCWCQKTRVIAVSCGIKISGVHHLILS